MKPSAAVSLATIEAYFEDGETVSQATLREKGLISRRLPGGIKILANGELTKKVKIEADGYSQAAEEKLKDKGISFTKV